MKKIILAILFLSSTSAFSQDSVKVTINAQTRDWEYIASFIYNDNGAENLYDSIKAKFRIANPPTGNTVVSVTAYTVDWLPVIQVLKKDFFSVSSGCASRIDALLRVINQPFLTSKLDQIDVSIQNTFQDRRAFGRSRLRRQ